MRPTTTGAACCRCARAPRSRRTTKSGRSRIIVSEIPYQVNKARLIERIAELVNEKKLEGISDLRDESDREGMRVVIELKRDAVAEVVLNQLYKHHAHCRNPSASTCSRSSMDAPSCSSLKEALQVFIEHRREVVTRRTASSCARPRSACTSSRA